MLSLIGVILFALSAHCTRIIEENKIKVRISYLGGILCLISGLLIGSAGIIWATRLTEEYAYSLIMNQRNTLDAGN